MKKGRLKQGKRGVIALVIAATLAAAPLELPIGHANEATSNSYKIIDQPVSIEGIRIRVPALNTDNTTYIALRDLNDSIAMDTEWDKAQQTITVTGRGRVMVLDLNSGGATLNDQIIYGLPAIVQNNTTYVPFRFLLERMGYGVSFDADTKVIRVEEIQENELKISTKEIKEDAEGLSLHVNYPQISEFADDAVQQKINDFLKAEAEKNAESGRSELEQAVKDNAEYAVDNPDASINPPSYDGKYTVSYNEMGRLSLYVDYHIYTGGAHGMTERTPYTFDLATGKLLTLKEVAEGNAEYVSIINYKIKSQIKARGIELLNPFKTIEPDRDFFLKHNGIVVYFSQYEYTPYAAGMPEFEVPFEEFK